MRERKKNWSKYWMQGNVDSCTATLKSPGSEINLFWEQTAKGLKPGDLVVDLCTGAGAVIKELLSKETLVKQSGITFKGIELSNFDGQIEGFLKELKSNQNIELINNTSIEALPFEDKSVNVFVSQYGIEYSLTEEFYNEIARVVKVNGKLNAILHHQNSILYRVAEEEMRQYKLVVDKTDLFSLTKKMIPYFALLKNPANIAKLNKNQEAIETRNNFNKVLKQLKLEAEKSNHPDFLLDILDVSTKCLNIAKSENKKAAIQFISDLEIEIYNSYERSRELCQASLSENDMSSLLDELSNRFLNESEVKALYSNKEIVGWGLSVTRLD